MKACPICGAMHPDEQAVCHCGADLSRVPPAPARPAAPMPQGPPAALGYGPPPPFVARPMGGPGWPPLACREYTWTDILTILGFSAALAGYFWAGVLLLPLGLVASLIGFRGPNRRGLAVAGIVVSAIGVLLKVMMMLNEAGLLPYWFTDGILFS